MSGINYKTSFQDIWSTDHRYKLWLQKDAEIYSAKCKVCSKSFSVAGQSRKALDTHAKGLKHQQRFLNHSLTLKTVFAARQIENRPNSSSKQTFSLLRKMKQQKKLRQCGSLKLSQQI